MVVSTVNTMATVTLLNLPDVQSIVVAKKKRTITPHMKQKINNQKQLIVSSILKLFENIFQQNPSEMEINLE